jgi:hypothetical protein
LLAIVMIGGRLSSTVFARLALVHGRRTRLRPIQPHAIHRSR